MAIEKVEMFTVICDNCKEDIGSSDDYSCWNDKDIAEENAMENDWLKQNGKHYCPSCHSYGDNDELIINESRFKSE